MKKYDVILIGAGLIGLASAYHIKLNNPDLSVVVIEQFPTISQGNSGRSIAGFRDLFSTITNFKLANSSILFYKHIQNDLQYDIEMKFIGYLFLMSSKKFENMKNILKETSQKISIEILDQTQLSKIEELNIRPSEDILRHVQLDPIEYGVLGKNCGILEIDKLSSFYYEKCVEMGIEFKFNTRVKSLNIKPIEELGFAGEPFLWQNKIIDSVSTDSGEIKGDKFILATGAWTNQLLDPIGVDSHIRPKKRYVYQISGKGIERFVNSSYDLNDEKIFPFTVLPSFGIYFRPYPKNNSLWVSTSGTTSDEEIGYDFSYGDYTKIEYDDPPDYYFNYNILPILRAYLNISDFKISGKWTGYYSLNTQDKTPYIFPVLNGIIVTGASGAGVMKADSLGRVVEGLLSGKSKIKLYNDYTINTSALGVTDRDVGIEMLRF